MHTTTEAARLPKQRGSTMIRQAQSYLAGAASSAALIGAAIAAFVLLASLSAFRDWPLPNLGGAGDDVATVSGPPVAAQAAANALAPAGDFVAANAPVGPPLTSAGVPVQIGPSGTAGPVNGTLGTGGPQIFQNTSDVNGLRGGAPTYSPGGSSTGTGSPSTSLSGGLNDTINGAVGGVDQALGNPLKNTGLDQTINGTTDALLGQGSTVGGVVDGVGGLLAPPGGQKR